MSIMIRSLLAEEGLLVFRDRIYNRRDILILLIIHLLFRGMWDSILLQPLNQHIDQCHQQHTKLNDGKREPIITM